MSQFSCEQTLTGKLNSSTLPYLIRWKKNIGFIFWQMYQLSKVIIAFNKIFYCPIDSTTMKTDDL